MFSWFSTTPKKIQHETLATEEHSESNAIEPVATASIATSSLTEDTSSTSTTATATTTTATTKDPFMFYEPSLPSESTELQTCHDKIKRLENMLHEYRKDMQRLTSLFLPITLYYDGSLYQGEFSEKTKIPNGYGIIVYADGTRYAGQWHEGKFHGKGTLYIYGAPAFHAEWEHGVIHGDAWYEGHEKYTFVNGTPI